MFPIFFAMFWSEVVFGCLGAWELERLHIATIWDMAWHPPLDEVPVDEAHLDYTRQGIVQACEGVNWEAANRRLGSSATSIAGVLPHLTNVERMWFRFTLAGESGVVVNAQHLGHLGIYRELIDGRINP